MRKLLIVALIAALAGAALDWGQRRIRIEYGRRQILARQRAAFDNLTSAELAAMDAMTLMRRPSVAMIGDSIFARARWNEIADCPSLINRAHPGDTTYRVLKRLPDIIKQKPAAAVVMVGINDIAFGLKPPEIADNIERIARDLKDAGIHTALVPVMPVATGMTAISNETIKEVNAQIDVDVQVIDAGKALAGPDGGLRVNLTRDGTHPNAAGYKILRDRLLPFISRWCHGTELSGPEPRPNAL